jgi:hypothetical protein
MLQLGLWHEDTQTKHTPHRPWCGDNPYALGWSVIKPQAMLGAKVAPHHGCGENKNNLFAKGVFKPGPFECRILYVNTHKEIVLNLEEPIRLPSPHRINFSVCLFVCLEYENAYILNVGIKIRVSTWSFLSIVRPLRLPIPMCEKKVRVQQENSYKITYCYVYFQPNSCNTQADCEWARGTFLRQRRKVPPAHAQRV